MSAEDHSRRAAAALTLRGFDDDGCMSEGSALAIDHLLARETNMAARSSTATSEGADANARATTEARGASAGGEGAEPRAGARAEACGASPAAGALIDRKRVSPIVGVKTHSVVTHSVRPLDCVVTPLDCVVCAALDGQLVDARSAPITPKGEQLFGDGPHQMCEDLAPPTPGPPTPASCPPTPEVESALHQLMALTSAAQLRAWAAAATDTELTRLIFGLRRLRASSFEAEAGLINAEVRLRVHRDDEATLAERRRADELEERLAVVTEEMGVLRGEIVFNPPTHFSHMSHPTFPTSHILYDHLTGENEKLTSQLYSAILKQKSTFLAAHA